MTRNIFLCLTILLTAVYAEASTSKNKQVFNKFVPPKTMVVFSEERPQVVKTGEFSVFPMPAAKKNKAAKNGSLASKLLPAGENFVWRPSKLSSSAIGIADITGAALSSDGSVTVISERIGGEGKTNSTRFLLFDIPARRLAGGFEIPELLLTDITFSAEKPYELLAIRKSFAPFNTKDGIVRIDLKSRKITDSIDSPAGRITSYAAADGNIIFTAAGSKEIHLAGLNDFSSGRQKIKTRLSAPQISCASGVIAAFDSNGLEIFRKHEDSFASDEEVIKVPEKFTPCQSAVIDGKLPAICFIGAEEEPLWYFRKNGFRKLKDRCGGFFSYDRNDGILYAGVAANSRIALFSMPEAEESPRMESPNRLKPANRNGNYTILSVPALKKHLIQVDNRGNVFLLDLRKKRWKKSVIYIADKAGFRK